MTEPVIVVHGGAGDWPKSKRIRGLSGVRRAANNGYSVLRSGRSSLDAVESAVVSLEDNPVFNAGIGSTLNILGEIETDAAMMDGRKLEGAGVALVRGVKNPIRLARIVMEQTDHALIAGYGAERIAAAYGLPTADLAVQARVSVWRRQLLSLKHGGTARFKKNLRLMKTRFHFNPGDTVGALAVDRRGNLAAACSTGGVSLKLPGRIGDSAILGAGLYADNRMGAATATGIGEIAMRSVISKMAVEAMKDSTAEEAALETVRVVGEELGQGVGMLTLDRKGRFGIAHNTPHLCWAALSNGKLRAQIFGARLKTHS